MNKKSIKEIEELLLAVEHPSEKLVRELRQDSRKGVKLLLDKWERKEMEKKKKHEAFEEMKRFDYPFFNKYGYVAGIDEVGRGPLAGPVIAAAVILHKDFYLPGINDSKQLSKIHREEYYDYIMKHAISVGIGVVSAHEIDVINIYEATKKAMTLAVSELHITPDFLLVDAMTIPLPLPQEKIIKGDEKSIAIAASSIIAKVTRDRIMVDIGNIHPEYGFENHMGYGTAQHIEAIEKYGIIKHHRRSFSPIKEKENPLLV